MRGVFIILALCIFTSNAALINFKIIVNGIVNEAEKIAVNAAEALEHQMENIVLEPLHQLDEAVQGIEVRREESEECVIEQNHMVVATVDQMHDDMNGCRTTAARTSTEIMNDVNAATHQLVFDGYDLITTYEQCKNYINSVLKKSCYAKLSVKATLYMKNAPKSINTIQESTNERIPAVLVEADACTHTAADEAILALDNVQRNIDSCIIRI